MAETDNGNGAKASDKIQDWALKTAGTIVGSLGVAGSMVVIGSGVLWIRFKEAGIPAVQAVSVQPRQEALVQGAQTTIFFVLVALALVTFLYVVDFPKENGDEKAGDKGPDPGARRPIKKRTYACIAIIPWIGLAWLISTSLGAWWVAGLFAGALVMTAGCLWIGRRASKNFWALAAAVFVAIIVFSGASVFAITQSQKFAQAVAILRGSADSGLTGYFVAVTEKKIYFANSIGVEGATAPERKPLQSVKVDDELTYSVGPLESQPDATVRAESMLKKLVADRKAAEGGATASTAAAPLPDWVSGEVASTFSGSVKPQTEVPESLCLMRYSSTASGRAKGAWWTSCEEAEALASIDDVRSRFALPHRFQATYDRRVRVEVPAGSRLAYVEGDTAPQCGGAGQQPCGHRYPGGGLQYWIAAPDQLGKVTEECTTAAPDEDSAWKPCN